MYVCVVRNGTRKGVFFRDRDMFRRCSWVMMGIEIVFGGEFEYCQIRYLFMNEGFSIGRSFTDLFEDKG